MKFEAMRYQLDDSNSDTYVERPKKDCKFWTISSSDDGGNTMRILVCGGREFDDWQLLRETLQFKFAAFHRTLTIIQGGAKGADFLARVWAKWMNSTAGWNVEVEEYPANWKKYGKGAGPIRNKQMLDEGKPDLVVAFPGGSGTANMIKQAKEAGVGVIEVE